MTDGTRTDGPQEPALPDGVTPLGPRRVQVAFDSDGDLDAYKAVLSVSPHGLAALTVHGSPGSRPSPGKGVVPLTRADVDRLMAALAYVRPQVTR